MEADSANDSNQALGLYFHVPFCKHACPYCDFYKMELRDRPARTRLEFPALLAREHALLLAAHPHVAERPPTSIYFGGGTPSVLRPGDVKALINSVRARHPASDPEVTLEANPENLTPARCEAWADCGIDRLSIGVQSFHARELQLLERLHEADTIARAVQNARAAGIANLSLDLMFALPGQGLAQWLNNLRHALELEPDHLSFYGLTVHEGTPFHSAQRGGLLALPDEDAQAEMYLAGCELLREAGFEHYEISNFARPGRRSIHNQLYWSADDVLGFGPGAHSNLGAMRWRNPEDLDDWEANVQADRLPRTVPEELASDVAVEEELFRRMRRCEGFRRGAPGAAHALFFRWLDSPEGQRASAQGWIARRADGSAALTEEGWLRSDALLLRMTAARESASP